MYGLWKVASRILALDEADRCVGGGAEALRIDGGCPGVFVCLLWGRGRVKGCWGVLLVGFDMCVVVATENIPGIVLDVVSHTRVSHFKNFIYAITHGHKSGTKT